MSKILEVKTIVLEFLKENVQCHEISVVKIKKGTESWEAIAEVYEDDSFLKSMNLPPKKKRVFYIVKVDETNEVTAYERFTEYPATDE